MSGAGPCRGTGAVLSMAQGPQRSLGLCQGVEDARSGMPGRDGTGHGQLTAGGWCSGFWQLAVPSQRRDKLLTSSAGTHCPSGPLDLCPYRKGVPPIDPPPFDIFGDEPCQQAGGAPILPPAPWHPRARPWMWGLYRIRLGAGRRIRRA